MGTSTAESIESVSVVLIDPRPERRTVIRRIIEHCGVADASIVDADDGPSAIACLEERPADLVVVEIQMPLADGLDAIAAVRQHFGDLAIVVCSFHRDAESKQRALAAGADVYLEKPISPDDFRGLFQRLLADPRHRLHESGPTPEPVPALHSPTPTRAFVQSTGTEGGRLNKRSWGEDGNPAQGRRPPARSSAPWISQPWGTRCRCWQGRWRPRPRRHWSPSLVRTRSAAVPRPQRARARRQAPA